MAAGRDIAPEEIVRLDEDVVWILDQRRLPEEEVEIACRSADDVAEAIRTLAIRGAPAIGIAAAMGFALAAARGEDLDRAEDVLVSARPTAVNLAWAVARMREAGSDPQALADAARELHRGEVERCRLMSEHGLSLFQAPSRPLTHCNTGALATGGIGTALGVVRAAFSVGLVQHVLVDETRPLGQGGRLTAWELARAGVPFSVIADSAAGAMMARGEVTHVLVGADRIAANGDVANKIGTYGLAVLAAHHGIPFVVVAPSSTVDLSTADGTGIPVEERSADEVNRHFPARNPAFDVTGASLVGAIVTEAGVHRAPFEPALRAAVAEGER